MNTPINTQCYDCIQIQYHFTYYYREGGELGSGAFGTVNRARWLHKEEDASQTTEEEVAVKSIEGGASDMDRIKFLQEAAIMGQFNHPNIVKILGIMLKADKVCMYACIQMAHMYVD